MTVEKEWTQEEIDNEYRQFWINRNITEQDLFSFYDLLFMTSEAKHYERWIIEAWRVYEQQSSQNVKLLLLIGKVGSLLEKIYES